MRAKPLAVRKWLNSGCILKLETSGFDNKPEVESKIKKKVIIIKEGTRFGD